MAIKLLEMPLVEAVEARGATGIVSIERRTDGRWLVVEREDGTEEFRLSRSEAGQPVVLVPVEERDL